nr:hypothetical protein [Tanacetum cinerariifolium]
ESLWGELYGVETSMEDVEGVCGVAALMEKKEEMWLFLGPTNVLRHVPFHVLQYLQLGFHDLGSLTPGNHFLMPLIPTFIASGVPKIVSSSRTPTVSGQVTNSLAICALYSALAIVMKLTLVAQW